MGAISLDDAQVDSSSDADLHAGHAAANANSERDSSLAAHHTLAASCDRAYLCVIWEAAPPVEGKEGQIQMPVGYPAAVHSARTSKDALGQSVAMYNAGVHPVSVQQSAVLYVVCFL